MPLPPPAPSRANWHTSKRAALPLTSKQKMAIGIIARKAYAKAQQAYSTDDLNATEWARREAREATGGHTISEATQGEFLRLRAHFSRLAGDLGQAFDDELNDNPEAQRVANAKFKIGQHLEAGGYSKEYADRICVDKFRSHIDHATGAQLEAVAMDLKNRVAAQKQRNAANA